MDVVSKEDWECVRLRTGFLKVSSSDSSEDALQGLLEGCFLRIGGSPTNGCMSFKMFAVILSFADTVMTESWDKQM